MASPEKRRAVFLILLLMLDYCDSHSLSPEPLQPRLNVGDLDDNKEGSEEGDRLDPLREMLIPDHDVIETLYAAIRQSVFLQNITTTTLPAYDCNEELELHEHMQGIPLAQELYDLSMVYFLILYDCEAQAKGLLYELVDLVEDPEFLAEMFDDLLEAFDMMQLPLDDLDSPPAVRNSSEIGMHPSQVLDNITDYIRVIESLTYEDDEVGVLESKWTLQDGKVAAGCLETMTVINRQPLSTSPGQMLSKEHKDPLYHKLRCEQMGDNCIGIFQLDDRIEYVAACQLLNEGQNTTTVDLWLREDPLSITEDSEKHHIHVQRRSVEGSATFYQSPWFEGQHTILAGAVENVSSLWVETISSFQCNDECSVILYEQENFSGYQKSFIGDTGYIANSSILSVSSLVVLPYSLTQLCFHVYEYANFEGKSAQLCGDQNLHGSHWDNTISSLKVDCEECSVILYDRTYEGKFKSFIGQVEYLGREWDNVASSIQIRPWDTGLEGHMQPQTVLYEHSDYKGRKMMIRGSIGYVEDALKDDVSSIKCDGSCSILVFVQTEFAGNSRLFSGSQSSLSDFDDTLSSLLVIHSELCVTFYEHINYRGRSIRYCEDNQRVRSNRNAHFKFSSLELHCEGVEHCSVIIFTDSSFEGGYKGFSKSTPNIGSLWYDRVRSFQIRPWKVDNEFLMCATLYKHANYRGRRATYCGDIRKVDKRWNDEFSSLKLYCEGIEHCSVILYEHASFKGGYRGFSQNASYVGKRWNDRVSSIKIIQGKFDKEVKPSCVHKHEEKAYNVIQWIPVLSWIYAAASSAYYGAIGCKEDAKQRAIDMGTDLAMDIGMAVVTVLTAGSATAAAYGLRTGLQAGKMGLKTGIKAAVKAAGKAVKAAVKKGLSKITLKNAKSVSQNLIKNQVKSAVEATKMIKSIPGAVKASVKRGKKTIEKGIFGIKQSVKTAGEQGVGGTIKAVNNKVTNAIKEGASKVKSTVKEKYHKLADKAEINIQTAKKQKLIEGIDIDTRTANVKTQQIDDSIDPDIGRVSTKEQIDDAFDPDIGAVNAKKQIDDAVEPDIGAVNAKKQTDDAVEPDIGAVNAKKQIDDAVEPDIGAVNAEKQIDDAVEPDIGAVNAKKQIDDAVEPDIRRVNTKEQIDDAVDQKAGKMENNLKLCHPKRTRRMISDCIPMHVKSLYDAIKEETGEKVLVKNGDETFYAIYKDIVISESDISSVLENYDKLMPRSPVHNNAPYPLLLQMSDVNDNLIGSILVHRKGITSEYTYVKISKSNEDLISYARIAHILDGHRDPPTIKFKLEPNESPSPIGVGKNTELNNRDKGKIITELDNDADDAMIDITESEVRKECAEAYMRVTAKRSDLNSGAIWGNLNEDQRMAVKELAVLLNVAESAVPLAQDINRLGLRNLKVDPGIDKIRDYQDKIIKETATRRGEAEKLFKQFDKNVDNKYPIQSTDRVKYVEFDATDQDGILVLKRLAYFHDFMPQVSQDGKSEILSLWVKIKLGGEDFQFLMSPAKAPREIYINFIQRNNPPIKPVENQAREFIVRTYDDINIAPNTKRHQEYGKNVKNSKAVRGGTASTYKVARPMIQDIVNDPKHVSFDAMLNIKDGKLLPTRAGGKKQMKTAITVDLTPKDAGKLDQNILNKAGEMMSEYSDDLIDMPEEIHNRQD